MARQEESLSVLNQRKHWKEGIKRLIEECDDPEGVAILESFYEEVDKLKIPKVDAWTNKKYLERHKEKEKEHDKEYWKNYFREYHRLHNADYYQTHKDEINKKRRERYRRNSQKILQYQKEYRKRKKESCSE